MTPTQNQPQSLLQPAALAPINWRHVLLIVATVTAVYVPTLGIYGMFDPWETHYTEVARQFMVRGDWLSTYWHNGTGPEGWSETNFWSKPVGSFWLSGLSLKLFGYSGDTPGEVLALTQVEWAVRLPFFLCGLFSTLCMYWLASRLFSPRAGIFSALVLATSPLFFMITRQAMTDMPYVGPMAGGICLLILGLFGAPEPLPRKERTIGKWTVSWPHAPIFYGFVAAYVAIMAFLMWAIVPPLLRVPLAIKPIFGIQISSAIGMLLYLALAAVALWSCCRSRTRNEIYLHIFYLTTAIAGLSKGLIGALQPGMFVLLYIVVARQWQILRTVGLFPGLLIAISVAFPWYHGMVAAHGLTFWNDFFGTEQFRRLTIGEQAQAKGTFEYYLPQLAYGLFPWIAFLPAALIRAFNRPTQLRDGKQAAELFIFTWFIGTFLLFTITLTKYHHYILPAIPPAALLIGLYIDRLIDKSWRNIAVGLVFSAAVLLLTTYDLAKQPAQWIWMYTYLYGSQWAQGAPTWQPILGYGVVFALLSIGLYNTAWRRKTVWALIASCVIVGGVVLNWYQVKCAPNWSQKYVLATYYKMRRSPQEELIAWQFNWRGETWYTAAQVVVSKSLDNTAIINWLKERPNQRFFFITERSRYGSLRDMLPTDQGKRSLKVVDDSNVHYVLAMADL